jgi:hypothetical protein
MYNSRIKVQGSRCNEQRQYSNEQPNQLDLCVPLGDLGLTFLRLRTAMIAVRCVECPLQQRGARAVPSCAF